MRVALGTFKPVAGIWSEGSLLEDYALNLKFGKFIVGTNCIRLTWDIWKISCPHMYAKSRLSVYDPAVFKLAMIPQASKVWEQLPQCISPVNYQILITIYQNYFIKYL